MPSKLKDNFFRNFLSIQKGFAPVIIVLLISAIFGSSFLIVRNLLINSSRLSTPKLENQSTKSAEIKATPSPLKPSPIPLNSAKPSPKASPITSSVPSASNSNSNNSSTNSSSSSNSNNYSPSSSSVPNASIAPSPSPSAAPAGPFVKVSYPNGGESFRVGDNVSITWETNMTLGSCQIQTIDSNNSGSVVGNNVNVTLKSINWTATIGNTSLTQKQLKINMICNDYNGGTQFAKSDNYFTVSQ